MTTVNTAGALIQVFAFLACVVVGYVISIPLRPPENPTLWVLLVAAVFVIGYLPPLTFPVVIFGAPMQFSMLLWGLGAGLIVGLMLKRGRTRPPDR